MVLQKNYFYRLEKVNHNMKISLCQINTTVGDIEGNCAAIISAYNNAAGAGADVAVFSELAIIGYSPEDLVLRPSFQELAISAVHKLAGITQGKNTAIIVGNLCRVDDKLYNAVYLLESGVVKHVQRKWALPNYGVFDEMRVFSSGALPEVIEFKGMRLGLIVCEDMWRSEVARALQQQKPDLVIAVNASPYEVKKRRMRTDAAKMLVLQVQAPLVYLNQVGGQDELVFDGNSFFMDTKGEIIHNLPGFQEHQEIIDFNARAGTIANSQFRPFPDTLESIYTAMTLGLRDYVNKNGFKGVVLGLSGGIDSAVSVAVAVDALGAGRVRGLLLPSRFTSNESIEDAENSACLLGIRTDTISIEPVTEAVRQGLSGIFAELPEDVTEENIQSRARAIITMAVSNKFGLMVLTTGNKSEMSVGYATLYGDLCGGYSVLKDVYKMTVYALASWRNLSRPDIALGADGLVIPEHSITRVPSAELKPNQTDQDSLPPYHMLDAILEMLVDRQMGVGEIVKAGYDQATVQRVAHLVYSAEYKRRQSPPGVKITNMAFGRDRRYPITNKYRE